MSNASSKSTIQQQGRAFPKLKTDSELGVHGEITGPPCLMVYMTPGGHLSRESSSIIKRLKWHPPAWDICRVGAKSDHWLRSEFTFQLWGCSCCTTKSMATVDIRYLNTVRSIGGIWLVKFLNNSYVRHEILGFMTRNLELALNLCWLIWPRRTLGVPTGRMRQFTSLRETSYYRKVIHSGEWMWKPKPVDLPKTNPITSHCWALQDPWMWWLETLSNMANSAVNSAPAFVLRLSLNFSSGLLS